MTWEKESRTVPQTNGEEHTHVGHVKNGVSYFFCLTGHNVHSVFATSTVHLLWYLQETGFDFQGLGDTVLQLKIGYFISSSLFREIPGEIFQRWSGKILFKETKKNNKAIFVTVNIRSWLSVPVVYIGRVLRLRRNAQSRSMAELTAYFPMSWHKKIVLLGG